MHREARSALTTGKRRDTAVSAIEGIVESLVFLGVFVQRVCNEVERKLGATRTCLELSGELGPTEVTDVFKQRVIVQHALDVDDVQIDCEADPDSRWLKDRSIWFSRNRDETHTPGCSISDQIHESAGHRPGQLDDFRRLGGI